MNRPFNPSGLYQNNLETKFWLPFLPHSVPFSFFSTSGINKMVPHSELSSSCLLSSSIHFSCCYSSNGNMTWLLDNWNWNWIVTEDDCHDVMMTEISPECVANVAHLHNKFRLVRNPVWSSFNSVPHFLFSSAKESLCHYKKTEESVLVGGTFLLCNTFTLPRGG